MTGSHTGSGRNYHLMVGSDRELARALSVRVVPWAAVGTHPFPMRVRREDENADPAGNWRWIHKLLFNVGRVQAPELVVVRDIEPALRIPTDRLLPVVVGVMEPCGHGAHRKVALRDLVKRP